MKVMKLVLCYVLIYKSVIFFISPTWPEYLSAIFSDESIFGEYLKEN